MIRGEGFNRITCFESKRGVRYKAVEGLSVGDVIDLEGFLYWYNGANIYTTSLVTVNRQGSQADRQAQIILRPQTGMKHVLRSALILNAQQ